MPSVSGSAWYTAGRHLVTEGGGSTRTSSALAMSSGCSRIRWRQDRAWPCPVCTARSPHPSVCVAFLASDLLLLTQTLCLAQTLPGDFHTQCACPMGKCHMVCSGANPPRSPCLSSGAHPLRVRVLVCIRVHTCVRKPDSSKDSSKTLAARKARF